MFKWLWFYKILFSKIYKICNNLCLLEYVLQHSCNLEEKRGIGAEHWAPSGDRLIWRRHHWRWMAALFKILLGHFLVYILMVYTGCHN